MGDEAACLAAQPLGENSARHDNIRAHAARTAKETYLRPQQRQRRLNIIDEQESENHAEHSQERWARWLSQRRPITYIDSYLS